MVATNFSTKKPPTLGVRFSSHFTLHFSTSVKRSEGNRKAKVNKKIPVCYFSEVKLSTAYLPT